MRTFRPFWSPLAAALWAVVAVGCNELPKRLLPGAPLNPSAEALQAASPGVPTVVYSSPQGSNGRVREVVVIFSEPMATSHKPLVIEPAVAGETRWAGAHTLIFVPQRPFDPGRYEASVPAATAADGAALGAPYRWSFMVSAGGGLVPGGAAANQQNPNGAPLIVERMTVVGGDSLRAHSELTVVFNGPVSPQELERNARWVLPDGKSVPVTARHPRHNRRVLSLKSKSALPKGVGIDVEVKIAAGLLGEDGRPSMAAEHSRKFPTVAPLRIWSIECPASPVSSLRIYFSEDVDAAAVKQAVEVIPPLPLRLRSDESQGSRVALGGRFRAATEYRVRIPASFSSADSAPLGRDEIRRCTIAEPQPQVRFAVEGSLVEQAAPKQIPVWADLVPQVAIRLRKVDADGAVSVARRDEAASKLPVAFEERRKTDASKRTQVLVDPSPALRDGRGIVLIEVEGLDRSGVPIAGTLRRLLVNSTDLGLTTKQSPAGTLVWVTRLSSGLPVGGVDVSLRARDGKVLGTAKTGEDGVAEIAAKQDRWSGYYVIASQGDDLAWLKTDENQWMFMPSSFDVPEWSPDDGWQPGESPVIRGLVFNDRGIYRPGESVRLKGIVRREAEALETAADTPVWVEIKNAQGEQILTRDLKLSEFGTFDLEHQLSAASPLGTYVVSVSAGAPSWRGKLTHTFRVEEFRTPDFEVKVAAERRDYFPGETPSATVSGRYFFGAKMSRSKASWSLSSRVSSFVPPNHPGYIFRAGMDPWEGQNIEPDRKQIASDEGFLDEEGKKRLDVPGAESDRIYDVEATVTGMDRTQISGRTAMIVHPAAFYLGVQAEWTFMELTETFRADLVAVAPDGTRQVGVPIDGVIYQGDWESVRKLHQGGTASFTSTPAPKEVGRCKATSASAPARCEYQAKAGGQYTMWASAKDSAGRKVSTAISFYVLGPSTTSWAASDSVKITLRADKYEHKLGDTARILVQNPFPEAEALITIERERILKRFRQKLVGPAPAIRIPITEDMMPNVFVSVVLVRGRVPGPFEAIGDDPRRPLMRVGHAMVRVSPESRRAKVDVIPDKAEYRPGEAVEVKLRSVGPDGKPLPSELTVWAVDEGVLSLVAYKTPDPVKAFAGMRGLAVMTSDSRYRALRRRAFQEKGEETGGGGGADPAARKVFKAVAFFDPSVRTDANGEATVRFSLPDNLTTFRIMAVATTRAQRFGSGEAKIVSTKKLLVQPSLPRFLRAGDRIEAGVVVHNRTQEAGPVKVRVTASGVVVEGPRERIVRVEPGRAEEVRFSMRADAPGTAKLQFVAELGRERDVLAVTRNIGLQTVMESVGLSGEATQAMRHVIGPVPGARPDAGGLELVLSGSRLAGVAASLAYLMEYPYGCAEQTTSGLLPLIALRDVAAATGDSMGRNAADMIASGLRRLATFQRDSGGFSLWPDGGDVDRWVSGYVMFALAQARNRGLPVEAKVLEKGTAFLKKLLREPLGEGLTGRHKVNALYALTALGAGEPSFAGNFFEERASLDTAGRALLATTLIRLGDRSRATTLVTELLGELDADGRVRAQADVRARWDYYGSPVRTQALILEALAAYEPKHALVGKLADGILASRIRGHWRTTQEASYALFALASAEQAETTTERRVEVFVNGRKVLSSRFGLGDKPVQSLRLPMSSLGGTAELVVAPSGGAVRYSARLAYAPSEPPRGSTDRGLFLARTYERVKAPEPGSADFSVASAAELAAGELVRVTVHVMVPQALEHAVIDDPLPAGLEAVNVSLATEARGNGAGDALADAVFTHRELRDDRVVLYAPKLGPGLYRRVYLARATTPGRFGVPAVRGEGMYKPEVFGSTPATELRIVAPLAGVSAK